VAPQFNIEQFSGTFRDYSVISRDQEDMVMALSEAQIAQNLLLVDDESPGGPMSVAVILTQCKTSLIADWLVRAKKTAALNHLRLSDEERTGHLPKLVEDLIARLGKPELPTKDTDAIASPAAVAHGSLRSKQGYSAAMLIHESRILQVTIFGTLQKNLNALDFSLLLPDIMIIADEVDAQLTQTMTSFVGMPNRTEAA
jgi:hypothetical protein